MLEIRQKQENKDSVFYHSIEKGVIIFMTRHVSRNKMRSLS